MIDDVAMVCDRGLARETNQDSIYADHNGMVGIFVVADGMGGHSRGEVASSSMVEGVKQWWKKLNKEKLSLRAFDVIDQLAECICSTSKQLHEEFERGEVRGGTTLVVLLIFEETYAVLSVGDSRVYMAQNKEMIQINEDDVWENLPENQNLSYNRKIFDKRYGKLTMAAVFDAPITVKISKGILKKRDVFVVCSDGGYKYCHPKSFNKIVAVKYENKSAERILNDLNKEIVKNGAGDNYSIIICKTKR